MKKLLLTSVALTALFGGSAFAADLRPAHSIAPLPPPVKALDLASGWGVNVGYSRGEAKNDVTLLGVGHRRPHPGRWMASSAASRPATTISSEHGRGASKPTSRLSGQKGGETFPGVLPLTTVSTDHKLDWLRHVAVPPGLPGDAERPALWHCRRCLRRSQGDSATVNVVGVGSATSTSRPEGRMDRRRRYRGRLRRRLERAKLEYLYVDLRQAPSSLSPPPDWGTFATETRRTTDNIVRVGLNYKMGRRLLSRRCVIEGTS